VPLSPNAKYLLQQRYCHINEQPEEVFSRVAKRLSDGDNKFEEKIYHLMLHGYFLPNSPALYNAGWNDKASYFACFVLPVEDTIESIFESVKDMAKIFQSGGGTGFDFSKLRPKNAPLSRGGESSGPVSFIKMHNMVVETVKQGGYRRGAAMGGLRFDHPDILEFVRSKLGNELQNFNISVIASDSFMHKVDTDGIVDLYHPSMGKTASLKAKDLFDIICFCAWNSGDPGLLFVDRINRDNPFYPNEIITISNPCGEVPLLPNMACNLGSINLSKLVRKNDFDFGRFADICETAMQVLTNVNRLSGFPMPEVKKMVERTNAVGVGVMGFADALIKLGIYYDSTDCLDFIDKIGKIYKESTESYKPDDFHFYHRIIAPTGSLSLLADCSSGVEPVFSDVFERNLTIGKVEETREIYKSQYVRIAHEISPEWHIKIQAQWQKYLDGACSKTINMPYTSSVDDIKEAYKMAWRLGCKGITVFRNNSKGEQVLVDKSKPKCSDEECIL